MSLNNAIIVDLDGTLSNCDHRVHFVNPTQGESKNWKSFYEGLIDDEIHEWCHDIMKLFAEKGFKIILLTGRDELYRDLSIKWLQKFDVSYDALYMKKSGDKRTDAVIKREIYEEKIKPEHNVLFTLDDRRSVVDMWREIGLTCLQCAPGEF